MEDGVVFKSRSVIRQTSAVGRLAFVQGHPQPYYQEVSADFQRALGTKTVRENVPPAPMEHVVAAVAG